MGTRSRTPDTDSDVKDLPLSELNDLIARTDYRATKMKLSASLKRSAVKRLVWLEALREEMHGIAAPKRGRF